MAWTTIGTTNVVQTSTVLGYVYLQYDTSSSGSTWAVRLITGARSGYSFNVRFDNVTVDGNNQGRKTGVTQKSVVVWSGNLSGGRSISGSWSCPWSTGTKYYSISGTLPAKGSAPSGGSITLNSRTWNSVTATSAVTSWGGIAGSFEAIVVTGQSNGVVANANASNWENYGRYSNRTVVSSTSTLSSTMLISSTNYWIKLVDPIEMLGLTHYKLAFWNKNSAGTSSGFDNTIRYLPPAPSQFSYTDPGTAGAKTYPVTFAGVAANNHTTYDTAKLTRTIRYKIDDGSWVYVDNATVAAIDFVSSFSVTVPAGSTATIEGWQTYHGEQSEVSTITLANTNLGCVLYGSVNGQAKELTKVYASVNGQAKKLVKIYASVGGVAKKVYEDV